MARSDMASRQMTHVSWGASLPVFSETVTMACLPLPLILKSSWSGGVATTSSASMWVWKQHLEEDRTIGGSTRKVPYVLYLPSTFH